ncbi:MAG: trehalose-6-phosphate synthase, partial [Thermodesulfobacteriota bacterium]|nr:trehalose-6-phosphate synthase [Thermodesulfobacteriota bacterium]
MPDLSRRLIVVSNRLPVALKRERDKWRLKPGKGGLVNALAPVLRDRGGVWIGWSGAAGKVDLENQFGIFSREAGYTLHPVPLSKTEVRGFYQGFSNEVIWPLFHGFQSRCDFVPDYFRTYVAVNRKFAEIIARTGGASDYIWVHDYHLMHVASLLREMGCDRGVGFFLHIPFPSPDIFLKLPWRSKIIRALMDFDLVGFQTPRDRRNFLQCLNTLCRGTKIMARGPVGTVDFEGRQVRVGYFPIGIDFKSFFQKSRTNEIAKRASDIQESFKRRVLILGADRLDYTKGIPQRLEAIRALLTKYSELREKINFVQVVVPSREMVPEYQAQKTEIDSLVGEINGKFTRAGWVPIHYYYRNLDRKDLVAHYRVADMALVTPLRDGMNLVAKEYCACNISESGVLLLSEFAGAAAQLQRGALLV